MRLIFIVLAVLFSLTYPFLVYVGVQHFSPVFFAAVLALIALLRFFAVKDKKDLLQISLLLVVIVFSLVLAVTNNELLLRLYPVIISLMLALTFASSLRQPENILLRTARLAGKKISAYAPQYTRVLTLVWAIILLANAAVALYLALFASFAQWAFYCGFLSYVIFALFFGGELLYRRYYILKHQAVTHSVVEKAS